MKIVIRAAREVAPNRNLCPPWSVLIAEMRIQTFVALALAATLSSPLLAQSAATRQIEKSVDGRDIARVIIEVPIADIEIRSSRTEQVLLNGVVSREFNSVRQKLESQRIVDQTDIELLVRGRSVIIQPKLGPDARSRLARRNTTKMKLEITLPAHLDLQVQHSNGSVRLNGAFNNVEIASKKGAVHILMPKTAVREMIASTRLGEVTTNVGNRVVTREGFLPGSTHYLNEAGRGLLKVSMNIGDVNIELTD
jgi:hypothetical protein